MVILNSVKILYLFDLVEKVNVFFLNMFFYSVIFMGSMLLRSIFLMELELAPTKKTKPVMLKN